MARKSLIVFQQENSSYNSKKILIKIGSALTKSKGKFNYFLIKKEVKEISQLMKLNKIVLVTSGAVACGMEILKIKEKPKDIFSLQILSGIGQAALISRYKKMFAKEGIKIAQVLLTHHNFISKKERKIIIKIIESYLAIGILPIINENDLINKEELEYKKIFTDNDMLSAILAKELKIDLALMLTNVSGLYNKNPQEKDAKLIKEVKKINKEPSKWK